MYETSARYREAIVKSHRAIVHVQALTTIQFGPAPSGGLELPLRSGDVKLSSTSDVKGTIDLEVPGDYWDALQPYGVEVHAARGIDYGDGTTELVPLGYYRVQTVEQAQRPFGPIKVTGRDRIAQMMDARLLYPYAYPDGTTHRQLFDRMINGYVDPTGNTIAYGMYLFTPVPITFDAYDPDRATLPAGVVEDSIYDYLAKIADARGCVLRFDRLGQLVVERRDRAPGEPSVYTVQPGATGNLISSSRKVDRAGVYNVVVARGSDPAFPTGYRLAYNTDPVSPLRWFGPFGAVPRYYASPLLQTFDAADAAAETVLARYKGLPTGTTVVTIPDPSIDPLDAMTIVIADDNEALLSDEVTIPLVIGDNSPVQIVTRTRNEVPADTGGDGTVPATPATPPIVNAGPDATATVGQPFTRTATETGGGSVTSRSWTLVAGPGVVAPPPPTGGGTGGGTGGTTTGTPIVSTTVDAIVAITTAAYQAMPNPDPRTLYDVRDDAPAAGATVSVRADALDTIVTLTQTAYDAMGQKTPRTAYVITATGGPAGSASDAVTSTTTTTIAVLTQAAYTAQGTHDPRTTVLLTAG